MLNYVKFLFQIISCPSYRQKHRKFLICLLSKVIIFWFRNLLLRLIILKHVTPKKDTTVMPLRKMLQTMSAYHFLWFKHKHTKNLECDINVFTPWLATDGCKEMWPGVKFRIGHGNMWHACLSSENIYIFFIFVWSCKCVFHMY